jgi:hypothetical protein
MYIRKRIMYRERVHKEYGNLENKGWSFLSQVVSNLDTDPTEPTTITSKIKLKTHSHTQTQTPLHVEEPRRFYSNF